LINLKDLLQLNNIKFSDNVDKKHQKNIDMETKLIADDMRVPHRPFPENSSRETREELSQLIDYNYGDIDEQYVKDGDTVNELFKEYCNDNNLDYDEKYFKQILKESLKTIMSLKYYYNRPRPKQLAEFYGLDEFESFEVKSAQTPAYPSGHTTQGYLLAMILGKKYPEHYDDFIDLAVFITTSRIMGRLHYPSDCVFGKEVAKHIFSKLIQKQND